MNVDAAPKKTRATQKHFGTQLVDSLKCALPMNQIKMYYDKVGVYYEIAFV